MNLTIPKLILDTALARAASVADGKVGPPICGTTRLRATAGKLTITATDLNVTAISTLPATVKANGGICVEAKRLAAVIGALPGGDVTLGLDGAFLTVKSGKSTSRINGQPDTDYPKTPNPSEATFAAVSPANLATMIGRTLPAVSLEESRGAFCGILFEMGPTLARMVACDSNRLVRTECDLGLPARTPVVIPARGAKAIRDALKDADGAEVAFEGAVIMVRVGGATVAAKLMDMTYANYTPIIDDARQHKGRTIIARGELLDAIARAMIMTQKDDKESAHGIDVTIGKDSIMVHAVHAEHGDTREEVESALKGAEVKLRVQPKFLRAALVAIEGDQVAIETRGPLEAFVVRAPDSEATLAVVMVMRPDAR